MKTNIYPIALVVLFAALANGGAYAYDRDFDRHHHDDRDDNDGRKEARIYEVGTVSKGESVKLRASIQKPMAYSFSGKVSIPKFIKIHNGMVLPNMGEAHIIIDQNTICRYSFPSSPHFKNIFHMLELKECSGGLKDNVVAVKSNLVLKFVKGMSYGNNLLAEAKINLVEANNSEIGLIIPALPSSEGQIFGFDGDKWKAMDVDEMISALPEGQNAGDLLRFDGEKWNAVSVSEFPELTGAKGEKGDKGDKGDTGATGPAGSPGINGATGAMGPMGPQGPAGIQGVAGVAGPKGDKGDRGEQGPEGLMGAVGPQGEMGPMGPAGLTGLQGPMGQTGAKGDPGPQGPAGLNGKDGKDGSDAYINFLAGAGIVGEGMPISNNSILAVNVGVLPGQIPVLDASGRLPASVMPENIGGPSSGAAGAIQVAFLKDQKPSGTHGGDCVAGGWMTRTLNTSSGDSSMVSLGSDNSFELQKGKYIIESTAPAYITNMHQAKLINSTSGSDVLIGSSERNHASFSSSTNSMIQGMVQVVSPTKFQIQHRCAVSRELVGLGVAAGFGTPEVYTQVKITKIE